MSTKPMDYEKRWAALSDDRAVYQAESRDELLDEIRANGDDPDDFDIVAYPKSNRNLYV